MVRMVQCGHWLWNREMRDGGISVIGEVEGCRQIAADSATPGADIWLFHSKTNLKKPENRGVVEYLGADPAALRPGRDDGHRNAWP